MELYSRCAMKFKMYLTLSRTQGASVQPVPIEGLPERVGQKREKWEEEWKHVMGRPPDFEQISYVL